MDLLFQLLLILLYPFLNSLLVILLTPYWQTNKPKFTQIVSVFALCSIPNAIQLIMVLELCYSPISAASLALSLQNSSPYIVKTLTTITPFSFG